MSSLGWGAGAGREGCLEMQGRGGEYRCVRGVEVKAAVNQPGAGFA